MLISHLRDFLSRTRAFNIYFPDRRIPHNLGQIRLMLMSHIRIFLLGKTLLMLISHIREYLLGQTLLMLISHIREYLLGQSILMLVSH